MPLVPLAKCKLTSVADPCCCAEAKTSGSRPILMLRCVGTYAPLMYAEINASNIIAVSAARHSPTWLNETAAKVYRDGPPSTLRSSRSSAS